MIMPGMFTFGIPNFFDFTFRAGPQLPRLARGITNVESNSLDDTNCEANTKEIKAIAHLPSHCTGNAVSSPCGTFNKLPLEIRIMVYVRVLVYEDYYIRNPHKFLGQRRPILTEGSEYIEAIDAALLRTSKAIYREAIRILYSKNRFYFRKPSDITEFAHAGLGATPFGVYSITHKPSSVVNDAPYSRLTMIQRLNLRLSCENDGDDLHKLWSYWFDFIYPPEKQDQVIEFPVLECLSLDFMDWKLHGGIASKIRV